MLGRARLDEAGGLARLVDVVRHQHAERPDVGVELPLGLPRHLADRLVERQVRIVARGARVNLVVDVRDVADIRDGARSIDMAKQAEEQVEDDDRSRVADMGEVVDGRAADVDAHVERIDRDEDVLRPGQRVVEPNVKRHETIFLFGRRPEVGFDP